MLYPKLFLLLWLLPLAFMAVGMPPPSNLPLSLNGDPAFPIKPATIIDFLSSNTQYSYFLRHIQRLGLVPTINQMENVTVFAPVNSAFVDSEFASHDTKESVLRYFANQRFRVSYLNGTATVLNSLYDTKRFEDEIRTFPLKVSPDTSGVGVAGPYLVNDYAEIVETDGYAKHQRSFIQTIDHLLPQTVSLCDFLLDPSSGSSHVNGHPVKYIKSMFRSVFAIRKVHHMDQPSCEQFMSNVSTVFLPTDRYMEASLSDLERQYFLTIHRGLENPDLYPTKDAVAEVLYDALSYISNLLLPDLIGGLNGTEENTSHSSTWGKTTYNITFDSRTNRIRLNDKVWSVAGSTALTLTDGLVHLFDANSYDQTQAPNFVSACNIESVNMIPRKALYAMHFSQFASELKFYKKSGLIGEHSGNQTILIDASDRDDVFDDEDFDIASVSDDFDNAQDDMLASDSEDSGEFYQSEMSRKSFSMRQQMQYKFISGFIDMSTALTLRTPHYHRLHDSKLCSRKRIDSCFKIKITGEFKNGRSQVVFNDKLVALQSVIAAGNTSIYVLESDLTVPASFKDVIAQLISDSTISQHLDHVELDKSLCLQTLKYLDAAGLLVPKDNHHGYTVFLPCGSVVWDGDGMKSNKRYKAWNSLGLFLKYLESHPKVFEKVLRGNFLQDLIYSDFGLEDSRETSRMVKTLNGEFLNVTETFQEGDYNHVISLNETKMAIPLNSDVLFNQGVIHITQNVLLPGNIELTLRDLIHASQAHVFTDFIEKFPKLSSVLHLDNTTGSEYSLLVPSSESLQSMNITSDFSRLSEFLELHLIPNFEADTLLQCMGLPHFQPGNSSYRIHTNRTHGNFTCHTNPSSGKTTLTLMKKQNMLSSLASDHQVKILNYGCTKLRAANSSCVFLLDRPIDVRWLDSEENFLHVHIGWISVGIGIIIGVILFGFCITTMALCFSTKSTKKSPSPDSLFQPAGSSFMQITSDDDFAPRNVDYGYETDVDILRDENDQLLPKKGKRRGVGYGSLSPIGTPSAPRKIKKQGIIGSLGRERNLPC